MDKVMVVDTETTHYRPESAHVVEIGAFLVDLNDGSGLAEFSRLCNPGKDKLVRADRALEISGITKKEVLEADPIKDAALEFNEFVVRHGVLRLVGYNSNHYDSVILARSPWKIPREFWLQEMDVMLLAFRRMREIEPCPLEWLSFKQDYKWPRLEEAARHYGLTSEEQTHRALDDCKLTARLLMKLLGGGDSNV